MLFSASQSQDTTDENTMQSSLPTPPVTNKSSSSPVNSTTTTSTGTVTHRQLPVIHPREHNENSVPRTNLNSAWITLTEDQMFARSPPEPHHPRGWLVDLINR